MVFPSIRTAVRGADPYYVATAIFLDGYDLLPIREDSRSAHRIEPILSGRTMYDFHGQKTLANEVWPALVRERPVISQEDKHISEAQMLSYESSIVLGSALQQDIMSATIYSESYPPENSRGTIHAMGTIDPLQQGYNRRRTSFEESSQHDPWRPRPSQSPARCFVIDLESQDNSLAPSDFQDVAEDDVMALLIKALWPMTALRRRKMQCVVALLTIIAAPTCVSIMSSTGTNSIATTGAVTAIIAGGKFFFNAWGD